MFSYKTASKLEDIQSHRTCRNLLKRSYIESCWLYFYLIYIFSFFLITVMDSKNSTVKMTQDDLITRLTVNLSPIEKGTVIAIVKNLHNIDCTFGDLEETNMQFLKLGVIVGDERQAFFNKKA